MGSPLSTLVARADDGCPVDHKNMTSSERADALEQYKRLGHAQFRTSSPPPSSVPTQPSPSGDGSCPVDHANMSPEEVTAYTRAHKQGGGGDGGEGKMYDVYGQELDSSNMMPATPNQLPSPGQKTPLSTSRARSTIPKAGAEGAEGAGGTWTYPSPQMFYNALKRKGKADDVEETDMDTVVAVHNGMNERTWQAVLEWERRFHCEECAQPKLKKFLGRPHDLSPAARFRGWCRGYPVPFDRHDWTVDRCGEAEVRYVIDYYYRDGPDPIEIHVRPAVDSVGAVYDRVRRGVSSIRDAVLGEAWKPGELGTRGKAATGKGAHGWRGDEVRGGEELEEEEFAFLSKLTPRGIEEIAEDVQQRCAKVGEAFRSAGDDPVKMEKANVAVNYCMAQRICGLQAKGFMHALEGGGDESEAYGRMVSCLDRFHIVARRAILEASGVAQSGPEFPKGVAPASVGATPAPASSVE